MFALKILTVLNVLRTNMTLSLLPSRSHPQLWNTDLEHPSTLLIKNDFY